MKRRRMDTGLKILIALATVFSLAAVVLGVLAYWPVPENDLTKDENALIIGTVKYQDDLPVVLNVYFDDENDDMDLQLIFSTADETIMFSRQNQDENLVFVDLGEIMRSYSNNLGINYWRALSMDNRLFVTTECLNGFIVSALVEIDDCGIWFINVANESGAVPSTAHAYIYTQTASLGG